MEDKKTIFIIALSTILAVSITAYGEKTAVGKVDNKDTVYKNELYINSNVNGLNDK